MNKLKKVIIIVILLLVSILLINSMKFKLEDDQVDKDYIKNTYGNRIRVSFNVKDMGIIDQGIFYQALGSSDERTEKDIELQNKFLNEFEHDKYLLFFVESRKIIDDKNLNFDIQVINAKNESLTLPPVFLPIKIINGSKGGTYYSYYWIMELERKLLVKNYENDEFPIKMIVTFPNGQERVYIIKL